MSGAIRPLQALSKYEKVTVDLTGYNRYGRSFIDESFGGLIRDCNWTFKQLKEKLEIVHDDVPSIPLLAWELIEKASGGG